MAARSKTRSWAVVHHIGDARVVRLVVTGVPLNVTGPKMRELLDELGHGVRFQEAGHAWANHHLTPSGRWTPPIKAQARNGDGVARTNWAQLTELADSHKHERRLGLRLKPAVYARVAGAAAREGVSLNAFAIKALLAAADEVAVRR